MAIILSNLNRFYISFYRKIPWQICSKLLIKNPTTPCLCCHITLRNINFRRQAINDKLQGNVATYLRYGRVVYNRIKKGLLLSLPMK